MTLSLLKTPIIIIAAFALDSIFGDPQNLLHPIRIIGNCISAGIKGHKKLGSKSPVVQFLTGTLLTLIIVALSYTVTRFITWGFYHLDFWLGVAAEAGLCYFLIAPKALKDESMKVYRSLENKDIDMARKNLSHIVGRDTKNLSKAGIIKATVETVSENLSDGVIAPLIFICIGGAPLAMAYKAVNTLDSMLGYRNGEFEYFGKFAAKLDDAVNLIPSRVSAILMIPGSFFIGADTRGAARIFIRDRYNHKSPNSAQTESVCAGALGMQLGGSSSYRGKPVYKPTIGDDICNPVPGHIITSNRLMYMTTIIAVVLFAVSSITFGVLWGNGGDVFFE